MLNAFALLKCWKKCQHNAKKSEDVYFLSLIYLSTVYAWITLNPRTPVVLYKGVL